MALLPDRKIETWDLTRKITTVCEPGQFVCHNNAGGSGASVGDTSGTVGVIAAASSNNKFAGVTEHPHVTLDTTKYDLNRLKHEQLVNRPVTLMTQGFVVTNQISGTPAIGNDVFLAANGTVSPVQVVGSQKVGKFESKLDEGGYAKVRFSTQN